MKLYWLAVGFSFLLGFEAFVLFGAQNDEPYPGQSQHAVPPKDWFCTPTAADPDHKCACKRMDASAPVCDDPPKEDPVCTVYCHADHCRCPIICVTPEKKS